MDWLWFAVSIFAFIACCAFLAVKGLSLRVNALNGEFVRSCGIYDKNVLLIKRDFGNLDKRVAELEAAKKNELH